jgi:hypothetical protein
LRNSDCLVRISDMIVLVAVYGMITVAMPHAKSSRPGDDRNMMRWYILIMKHSNVQVIRIHPTTTITPP